MSCTGCPKRAHHEDGDKRDREDPQQPRAAIDRAGVPGDQSDEQDALDERQHPHRQRPFPVGEQDGQDHRGHNRGCHRPARLADDLALRSGFS